MSQISSFKLIMTTGTWLVLAFLIVPILVVFPVSITDKPYISLPQETVSLQHYVDYFTSERWLWATYQSVVIGLAVAFLATILGTAFAIGCWFLSNRLAGILRWVLITPILVPPVIQSLGFYRFWVQLGLIDSYTGVILAHTLLGLPYVTITVFAALANLDRTLIYAARSLGASVWQTAFLIVLPACKAGMITGAVFAFIVSFDEIVGVLFITVRRVTTLPKMIWQGIQDNIDPTIAAVATLLILLTFLVMVVEMIRRYKMTLKLGQSEI